MHPGHLVTDHLRLVRKLGEGGMGSVWVADHLKLETQVAVKFVSVALLGQAEARARFQREATSAAKIQSPHVVRVLDHGLTEALVPYIVMELLAGEDLGAIIERQARLSLPFVQTVLIQACKGLGKAHALGIVHRDIKPENIFISDEGGEPFVRLLDFGIAKQVVSDELGFTSSGTMMGTPNYMSPEQALSAKQVDLRTDLWSLAVVTYHALTGELPFRGETLGALSVELNAGHFEPVTALRPDLPPSLDAWFERALARQPEARFASAQDMAEAFRLAADTGVTRSPTLSAPKGAAAAETAAYTVAADSVEERQLRQRRSLLGLAMLAGLGAVGLSAAGWFWLARRGATEATAAPELTANASAKLVSPSLAPGEKLAKPVGANDADSSAATAHEPAPSTGHLPGGAPPGSHVSRSYPAAAQNRKSASSIANTTLPEVRPHRRGKKNRGF